MLSWYVFRTAAVRYTAPAVYMLISLQMLLPARRIDQVEGSMYDRWIDLIQGPELSRCDVTNMQRKMLLTIAVSYRAFFRADHPRVDITDFDIFAGRLATSARTLGPYDRADGELLNLVDYLELTLPEVRYLASLSESCLLGTEGLSTCASALTMPPVCRRYFWSRVSSSLSTTRRAMRMMSWGASRTLISRLSPMMVLFLVSRLTIAVPTTSRPLCFVLDFTTDVQFGILCLILFSICCLCLCV